MTETSKTISTDREDIVITTGNDLTPGSPIRAYFVNRHGDSYGKALTRDEAIDLARALLTAAEMPSPYAF